MIAIFTDIIDIAMSFIALESAAALAGFSMVSCSVIYGIAAAGGFTVFICLLIACVYMRYGNGCFIAVHLSGTVIYLAVIFHTALP